MYSLDTIGHTVDDINAFEISKKCKNVLTQQKIAFFGHFECIYLGNGISDGIKPIHFLKVINKDIPIKQTVFKYIRVEKMTSYKKWWILPYFDLKMQISREPFIQS